MVEVITKSAWARACGFTPQYVSKLVRSGLIPVLEDGKLDREKADAALAALQANPESGEGLASQLTRAKINSEIQRGELAKLSRLKKQGQLVERARVDDAVARIIQTVRDHFLSQPERVAGQVAALTDPRQIRDLMKADTVQGLSHLSQELLHAGNDRHQQPV